MGPVWVLATRQRAEADVTTAAEAVVTTAADTTGSGVVATLAAKACTVACVLEGVVRPSASASETALTSTAATDLGVAVVDAARVRLPSRRGCVTTSDAKTPPMALEALEAASSASVPPSSSISIGAEASMLGVAPLGSIGVLGRDVVEAMDDAGDIGGQ
ncbi:unnamed protein product [Phytophthora fragariaefolia]|uniref:Unnamed protein product n=1 Tax=Phytophthora fragariaefolia TaxID=1490495 RepID=A0A9W6YDU6_9STRA|nr:unnamed protein product [Phytophthora fragariaefolia]